MAARSDVQAEAAWTVPAAIVAGGAAGQLAAVLVILPLAAAGAGDGDVTKAGLLLSSVAFGAALLGSIALLVRSSDPLTARRLLRPAAIALLLGVVLGLLYLLTHPLLPGIARVLNRGG